MKRGHFRLQATGLVLVLLGTLWLLARRVPGDRAAFFGAVAFFLLAFLGCILYLFQALDSDPNASGLAGAELNLYVHRQLIPRLRAQVRRYRFVRTFLAGLWIGSMAQHPWQMGGCAFLAEIAIGGAMDALPRFRLWGTGKALGRLVLGIALGVFLREWLLH